MSTDLTWRKAIDKILGASTTPLHYNDITEKIISEGLRQSLGATLAATVNAQISASIKHTATFKKTMTNEITAGLCPSQ